MVWIESALGITWWGAPRLDSRYYGSFNEVEKKGTRERFILSIFLSITDDDSQTWVIRARRDAQVILSRLKVKIKSDRNLAPNINKTDLN